VLLTHWRRRKESTERLDSYYYSIVTTVKLAGMLVLGLGFGLVLGLEISRPRTISRTSKM